MTEVLYVVDFEAIGEAGPRELKRVPLLVFRKLAADEPTEGEEMPAWPSAAAPVQVSAVDRTTRSGTVVAWGSVTLTNPGLYYTLVREADPELAVLERERAVLTALGEQALAMIVDAAVAQGWEVVDQLRDVTLTGEIVVTTGGAPGPGFKFHERGARYLLAAGEVLDEAEVVYCRSQDLDERIGLRIRGGEVLEGVFDLDGRWVRPGTLGRLAVGGFVPYADQTLRRVPDLDTETELGWRCEARPAGFRAPRSLLPGKEGAFIPAGERLELRIPPEFAALCAAKVTSPREVLEAFMADVADLSESLEMPREDGLGAKITSAGATAQSYFDHAWR